MSCTERAPCENFLYVFKAALTGPHAPPTRRGPGTPLGLHARPAERRSAGADEDRAALGAHYSGHEVSSSAQATWPATPALLRCLRRGHSDSGQAETERAVAGWLRWKPARLPSSQGKP